MSWKGEEERRQVKLNHTDQSYHDVVSCILAKEMKYSDVIEIVELHVRMLLEKRNASMSYLALEALDLKCPNSK